MQQHLRFCTFLLSAAQHPNLSPQLCHKNFGDAVFLPTFGSLHAIGIQQGFVSGMPLFQDVSYPLEGSQVYRFLCLML